MATLNKDADLKESTDPYGPAPNKWAGWIKYLFGETDEAKKYLQLFIDGQITLEE